MRLFIAALAVMAFTEPAHGQERARLTGLADVNFGLVTSLTDTSISQSVCVYTSSRTDRYSVLALGGGAGNGFVLDAGPSQLQYEVLWADAPGATSGTSLVAGTLTPGFVSAVKQQTCNSGPPTSASLTIRLRDHVLQNARSGSYSGILAITIAPE
jgi:hypothetical protein